MDHSAAAELQWNIAVDSDGEPPPDEREPR